MHDCIIAKHYYDILNAGLAFWKAPKRKFFAIQLQNQPTRKTCRDNDHADEEPALKRIKLEDIFKQLNSMSRTIDDIKEDISQIVQVNKDMTVPLGLSKALSEVLKCKICHSVPMKPPIIYARCCRSILSCETCVNLWYNGEEALTKLCPLCGQGRGYNETIRILGFDDFASTVQKLFTKRGLRHELCVTSANLILDDYA